MMKQKWVRPQAVVQTFTPNEYVAACWGVACAYESANTVEKSKHGQQWEGWIHRAAYCGSSSNQYLQDTNNDGTVDKMTETGTDGLGNLVCTLYSDASYNSKISASSVKAGDYIYWTTSSGDKTWYHQGYAVAKESGHPNRS